MDYLRTLLVVAIILTPIVVWPLIRSARKGGALSKWLDKQD
jgi:hypothetical protein